MFVLPVLTYTQPDAAADALRWRHTHAGPGPGARRAARPRRAPPSRGAPSAAQECSAYWPAGTAAFHIERGHRRRRRPLRRRHRRRRASTARSGVELLVETARLWRSLGPPRPARAGSTSTASPGPDEYTRRGRRQRLHQPDGRSGTCAPPPTSVERYPDEARQARRRRRGGGALAGRGRRHAHPVRRASSGVHQQAEGFTRHQEWDFANTPPEQYPLLLHYPYFDLYRKQVVKQADLVLAMHWRGGRVHRRAEGAQLRLLRGAAPCGTRRCRRAPRRCWPPRWATSSWPTTTCGEAALMDLHDLQREHPRRRPHGLAGRRVARAGRRVRRDARPRRRAVLRPPALQPISRLEFSLQWRGLALRVDVRPHQTTYSLRHGGPDDVVELRHHEQRLRVTCDEPVTVPVPPAEPSGPPPEQPPGRSPLLRLPEREQ